MVNVTISPESEAFILRFEGGNDRLDFPGGDSGVTAACGYDFGYHDDEEILADWKGRVPIEIMPVLIQLSGLRGLAARDAARSATVSAIRIPYEVSLAVLRERTLPKFIAQTLKAFPGCQDMPDLSLGALVSLVYNRGASCDASNQRRSEMAAIRRYAADPKAWHLIPAEIAAMVRLWPGVPTDSNLPGRRLEEAALFARGLRAAGLIDPRTVIRGDSGPAAVELQRALIGNLAQIKDDGDFGLRTRQAVWRYQLASGKAPPTGYACMQTLYALGVHPRPTT